MASKHREFAQKMRELSEAENGSTLMKPNKGMVEKTSRLVPDSDDWTNEFSQYAGQFDERLQSFIGEKPLVSFFTAVGIGLVGALWLGSRGTGLFKSPQRSNRRFTSREVH